MVLLLKWTYFIPDSQSHASSVHELEGPFPLSEHGFHMKKKIDGMA